AVAPPVPSWSVVPRAPGGGGGALGGVGLSFAPVAEMGGPPSAGPLPGAAPACSWSGTLIGPPVFGVLLDVTGAYSLPWLVLTAVVRAVVITLPRLAPLVQRG